ncbi:MAG: transposase [Chloroflexi bacterium]|uniref:Transposase n=1 Tax=Candidatus Chlorohelix allophototropha TaxID=3003348 RepID=A0A8T7M669_9CHLR|nr:transposase [Chloroflexota bacterium]WJW69506.1 transposase [Chloroflexota bacterium L227-S17]
MFLPTEIITVLGHFRPHFTRPTFQKMLLLFSGVILTRGRHTVSAALRYLGLANNPNYAKFHHLLNQARYSTLLLSRTLLAVLLQQFVGSDQEVTLVIDETLERRWGRKLSKRGHWRDSLLSSGGLNITNSGLR